MPIPDKLIPSLVVASWGSLQTSALASAHAGETHAAVAATGFSGSDRLALAAVVVATGIVYWLTNRDDRPSVDADHHDRIAALCFPGSIEPRASITATHRSAGSFPNTLVAERYLRPPRHRGSRKPPRPSS